jgi:transcriptional regulator with XRE-family HTH domain
VSTTENHLRAVPDTIYRLPLAQRWSWARKTTKLSHDRIVELMGRSNRSHLIKIEKGDHTPRPDLRDAYADALGFPRDLFADDTEEDASGEPFRDGSGGSPDGTRAATPSDKSATGELAA